MSDEIQCPLCLRTLGKLTPEGLFHADIVCARCDLNFIIQFPAQGFYLHQASALVLLIKKWGYVSGVAWQHVRELTVIVGNVQLILWDSIVKLEPHSTNGWAARRDNAIRRGSSNEHQL